MKHAEDEGGFVMVTVVIVLIAILLPLVIITQTSQVASLLTAGRARNYALARNAATSLYSTIYEQANTTTEPFSSCAYRSWPGYAGTNTCPSPPAVTNPSPPWPSSWTSSAATSNTYNFVSFGASGSLGPCSTANGPCADFTVSYAPLSKSAPPMADVVIDAFDGCNGATALCVEVRYNAHLLRETYLDWLWFSDHTTVGRPGSTRFEANGVSYNTIGGVWTTGQTANGPVGTNAPSIYYCGTPEFLGPVTAKQAPVLSPSPGCTTTTAPSAGTGPAPPGAPSSPEAFSSLADVAAGESGGGSASYDLSGTNTVALCGSTIAVSPNTCASGAIPWPSSGVLYDSGNLTLFSGAVGTPDSADEPLTIAVTGNATVQGSLEVPLDEPSGDTSATDCTTGDTTPSSDCPAIVGIMAGGDIALSPSAASATGCAGTSSGPTYGNQTVDAVLMALGGEVYDTQWTTPASCVGTLDFIGSLVGNYQGMFGAGAQSNGSVETGYATDDFAYDVRLSAMQPPYFVNPSTTHWLDLSLAEVLAQ